MTPDEMKATEIVWHRLGFGIEYIYAQAILNQKEQEGV